MRYTGTHSQREQARRKKLVERITKTATDIISVDKLERLLLITRQIQRVDNSTESPADTYRDIINIWSIYEDDVETLKLMQKLVVETAMIMARRQQRATVET